MNRTLALAFTLLFACKGDKAAKTSSGSPSTAPSPAAPTAGQPGADKPVPTEEAKVAFELNGAPAVTSPSKADVDKQDGIVNAKRDVLIMTLHGGASDWPKRGALMLTAKSFTYAPGKLADAAAQFNVDGTVYQGPITLELTSLTEAGSTQSGRLWKAAGTFSGELSPSAGAKPAVPTMKITNGTFSDVPLQELGHKD